MVCLARILPLWTVLLLLASLAASQPAPTPPVPPPSISNQFKSIEKVDFANFTFPLPFPEKDCARLKSNTVPLSRGEFKDTSQEFGVEVGLGKIVYADLTGDHINEALVPLNCDPHGNYVDTVTLAYTLRDGEPVLLGRFANSNTERDYRKYYPEGFVFPVGAASVANGKVQIHRAADGSHACPENDVRFEYSWNGKSFVLSGEPVKRPLGNCGADEKPPSAPEVVQAPPTPPVPMGHEGIDRTLRACAIINDRDYSQHITLGATPWIHLNRGQEHDGYQLSRDGSLFYQGQMLAHNVPVSGASGREGDQWIYAQSVLLSPKSPSGRFAILQACEEQDLKGQCWALFVVDHGSRRIERTHAGKYGPTKRWVAWVRGDDEYAVLHYMSEGMTTLYRIHLPTSESKECGAKPILTPPPSSAASREPKGTGKNLIVLVHGCCTDENGVKEWNGLREVIANKIEKKEDWEIVVWDWHKDEETGEDRTPIPPIWDYDNYKDYVDIAYIYASVQGNELSGAINKHSIYEYIHLLGHSAGAKLIDVVAKKLAVDKKLKNKERPFIHLTFFDAYTRHAWKDTDNYGSLPNDYLKHYAEHYVDLTSSVIAPWTNMILPHAFNFDITDWQPDNSEEKEKKEKDWGHQWPRYWYEKSVTSPRFRCGFALSVENGQNQINRLPKQSPAKEPVRKLKNADCQFGDVPPPPSPTPRPTPRQ